MSRGILLAALSVVVSTAHAGETTSTAKNPAQGTIQPAPDTSPFDAIWDLATLYKNDANPIIEEFKLRGRYHGQYHWLDSSQGDEHSWEDRRSRFGFDARLFNKKLELRLDAQSADEFDPFYNGLVDAYVKWKPSDSFSLTLGRQKPFIAYHDFFQSTNLQPTFERSQIFNQLRIDRAVGALAEGKIDRWSWQAGVYSNQIDKEFGSFDGGLSFGAGLGYDFKDSLSLDKAEWRLDWLHSEIDANDTILNRYSDIVSSTFWLKSGDTGFVAEAFFGSGEAPDVFGFYLQPTYDIIPKKLQLVGRYTFSTGDGPDSLTVQSRYEKRAPELTDGGRGDLYQAGYLGLQYFIYGDKLKVLAGAEYSDLNGGRNGGDFDGWTFLTGVRLYF